MTARRAAVVRHLRKYVGRLEGPVREFCARFVSDLEGDSAEASGGLEGHALGLVHGAALASGKATPHELGDALARLSSTARPS